MSKSNPLLALKQLGQSIWCDQLGRSMIETGVLQRMIDEDGVAGVTSNPTIFEKSIAGGADYDEPLAALARAGKSAAEIYDALVTEDIRGAADVFLPVYEKSQGADGFISLEVSPDLADDADGTVREAHRLFNMVGRPNVMIKVPATAAGLVAVEQLLTDGMNINVTLIFSVAVYEKVAESYIRALEKRQAEGQSGTVASVASFFVSRIDTAVDKQLAAKIATGNAAARGLLSQAAIANSRLAYRSYQRLFESERFRKLGARAQRPLWASTSTKNPTLSDVLYVEELIGPSTVNTLPPATIDAFRDHGRPRVSITEMVAAADATIDGLKSAGLDFPAITAQLEREGVVAFQKSFATLMDVIETRRAQFAG